jgi:hypothetical protein
LKREKLANNTGGMNLLEGAESLPHEALLWIDKPSLHVKERERLGIHVVFHLVPHLIYKFTTSLMELGFQADRARR